jgi:glycosyltransferase involved in cell wall biosynthesis
MACLRKRTRKAFQISFRASRFGKTAPDQTHSHCAVLWRDAELVEASHLHKLAAVDSGLPKNVLYATSARIGGNGLDAVAYETLLGYHRAGILGKAIAYQNRQSEIPSAKIRSLRWHPVRLLSCLKRPFYYGAKKHYLDWIAAKELASGRYDLFHGWSGESVRSLRVARRLGIPTLLEIPTWHRNKGKQKPALTKSERELQNAKWPASWMNRLLISRPQVLEEYDLADLILTLSKKAAETFRAAGIPDSKLFPMSRGVDAQRFTPGEPPPVFRVVFIGALIKRKGVHLLLEAWHRLQLENAELVLVGSLHDEIRPFLEQFGSANVRVAGFSNQPEEHYRNASVHVFPSSCEGSAKAIYEAAACGLPQITTRESGDVVVDGVNGIIIPPDDLQALCEAMVALYIDPERRIAMGAAARRRIEEQFTWDHFRERVLNACRAACSRKL